MTVVCTTCNPDVIPLVHDKQSLLNNVYEFLSKHVKEFIGVVDYTFDKIEYNKYIVGIKLSTISTELIKLLSDIFPTITVSKEDSEYTITPRPV